MRVRTVTGAYGAAGTITMPREVEPFRLLGVRYQVTMSAGVDLLPFLQVGVTLDGQFCPCWERIAGQGQSFPGGAGGDVWTVCHGVGIEQVQNMTLFYAQAPAPFDMTFGPEHSVRIWFAPQGNFPMNVPSTPLFSVASVLGDGK